MSTTARNAVGNKLPNKRVIIVGAGLAGLCCAYELSKSGYRVRVLEANKFPGGRVQTLRNFSKPLIGEAGAYWVNETHTVVMRYFKELGIARVLAEVPVHGNHLLSYLKGKQIKARLSPGVSAPNDLALNAQEQQYGLGWAMATILSNPNVGNPAAFRWPPREVIAKYGKMTFHEFLAQQHPSHDGSYTPSEGAKQFIMRWFAWWDDPGSLSALAMIQYGVLGQRLCDDPMAPSKWFVSRLGMDVLPKTFAKKIIKDTRPDPFTYNAEVVEISQTESSVSATYKLDSGDKKTISADYLVCAIPFSTLSKVTVIPEFSEPKRKAIKKLEYARVARAYFQCKKGGNDLANGTGFTDLPIGNLLDMSFIQGKNRGRLLQAFMVGQQAERLADMTEDEGKAFLLPHMQTVFKNLRKPDVERTYFRFWNAADGYAGGAYPLFTPETFPWIKQGIMANREGRVHFAGEHTSEYTAWMEGALRSGVRVAREIQLRTMAGN